MHLEPIAPSVTVRVGAIVVTPVELRLVRATTLESPWRPYLENYALAPVEEIWRRRAFCRVGDGDVPIDEVLTRLRENGYEGWLVVEQDIIPDPSDPSDPAAQAAGDRAGNREYLRARGI